MTWGVAWGFLAVVLAGAALGWRTLRDALHPVAARTWLGLALVLATQAAVVALVVPAGPWHSFHHDTERWAELRDLPLAHDALAGGMHGPTWFVLVRTVGLVAPSWWAANGVLSVLATLVGFALARLLLEDDDEALAVTAVHALLPVRLRIATSVQLYVGAELALLAALFATGLHLRSRSLPSFLVALAALGLAMLSHLELLPLGPLAVLALVAARDPRWFVTFLPRPPALLALGAFALLLVPRVVALLGSPEMLPAVPSAVLPWLAEARHRVLLLLAALTAFAWVRPPDAQERLPRWPGVAALAAVLAAVPGVAFLIAFARNPTDPALADAGAPWRSVHALLSPHHTPAPWIGLWLVGAGVAWVRRPDVLRLVAPMLLGTAWLHAAHHDVFSTYVRIASIAAWPFALLVGVGLSAPFRAAPAAPRPLVATLPLLALGPYLPWLSWRYPEQHELPLLEAAHAHVAAGGVVVMPTVEDVPDGVDPRLFPLEEELRYLRLGVGEGEVLGLREALAADALPEGTLLLWPQACHLAVESRPERAEREPQLHVLLAGRVWRWQARDVGPFEGLAPCWWRPELATCAEPAGDGCAAWTCPPGLPEEPAPTYLDPLCAAVRDRFRWEPLVETPVGGPPLTAEKLGPGARVGLYRLAAP